MSGVPGREIILAGGAGGLGAVAASCWCREGATVIVDYRGNHRSAAVEQGGDSHGAEPDLATEEDAHGPA